MKRQIPNLITLGNLLCGVIATGAAVEGNIIAAALLICLGIFLDFFDGLTARLLNVASPLGKELDSLADVVTSGVAPAFILFYLIQAECYGDIPTWVPYLSVTALLMPLFAAYRLAKFNLDTRQGHSFLGLPVPANALIWVGLALSFGDGSTGLGLVTVISLVVSSLIVDILMVSEVPMFSLKFDFKDLRWKTNAVPYLFLIGCAAIIVVTRAWYSISVIIAWYILLSLITCKNSHVR